MNPPDYPMVLVVWQDPQESSPGWVDRDEFEPRLAICHTVGFLYVDDDPLTVVGSFTDSGQLSDATTIPRGCVRAIVRLDPTPQGDQPAAAATLSR